MTTETPTTEPTATVKPTNEPAHITHFRDAVPKTTTETADPGATRVDN